MIRNLLNFDVANFDVIPNNGLTLRTGEPGCFNKNLWQWIVLELTPIAHLNILEVGTWLGYGANSTSTFLKESKIAHEIVCVDTWLGSMVHYESNKNDLKYSYGYPQFFYDFLAITKLLGNIDTITPLVQSSLSALRFLKKNNVKFDIIVIDAEHEYEEVLLELVHSMPLLSDNGIIILDDYMLEPVARAAKVFISSVDSSKSDYKLECFQTNYQNQFVIIKKKK